MSDPAQVIELELVFEQTGMIRIPDKEKAELVATLKPVADLIAFHSEAAVALVIKTDLDAVKAADFREAIIADNQTAVNALNAFDDGLIERLFKLHRAWTALRARFSQPLEAAAKLVKSKIGDYEAERDAKIKAEEERLNAIEQARVRKEQEALLAKANKLKTPERAEALREQADSLIPANIHIQRPTSGTKFQERVAVMTCDLEALGIPKEVIGYFKIELHPDGRFRSATLSGEALCRAKSANSLLEIKGVEFKKIRC